MKYKKLLLVLILVITVSLFTLPASLVAINGEEVEDLQLTAVCSDNPDETRCWEITNPNNYAWGFQYYTYRDINNVDWWPPVGGAFDPGPISVSANGTKRICLPLETADGVITGLKIRWETKIIWGPVGTEKVNTIDSSCPTIAPSEPESESIWLRTMPMTCWQVWLNEDNNFEFIFWWVYYNNNWVQIFDMEGNLVWETDFLKDKPRFEVDLPDGMYKVQTFHEEGKILQEFIIGKP